jgi:hypothetical protein
MQFYLAPIIALFLVTGLAQSVTCPGRSGTRGPRGFPGQPAIITFSGVDNRNEYHFRSPIKPGAIYVNLCNPEHYSSSSTYELTPLVYAAGPSGATRAVGVDPFSFYNYDPFFTPDDVTDVLSSRSVPLPLSGKLHDLVVSVVYYTSYNGTQELDTSLVIGNLTATIYISPRGNVEFEETALSVETDYELPVQEVDGPGTIIPLADSVDQVPVSVGDRVALLLDFERDPFALSQPDDLCVTTTFYISGSVVVS